MAAHKHSNPYYNSIVSLINEWLTDRDKAIKGERTEKFDDVRAIAATTPKFCIQRIFTQH